jgi:hypothetical protein
MKQFILVGKRIGLTKVGVLWLWGLCGSFEEEREADKREVVSGHAWMEAKKEKELILMIRVLYVEERGICFFFIILT